MKTEKKKLYGHFKCHTWKSNIEFLRSSITYILQRYGKTIARCDVCMKIGIGDETKEGEKFKE